MKVKIKKFDVEMEVKNNGIEFQVHANNGDFLGDCYVTKTGLIWCRGRTTKANGIPVSWDDSTRWMET